MKAYSGVRIEYHILQSFPVTCLNRDDVGSPKSAYVGGVERGRVSSQCWKRQVRLAMKAAGIGIGVRTKHIAELIRNYMPANASEDALAIADAAAKALSDDTLLFLSESEAKAIADFAVEKAKQGSFKEDKKFAAEVAKQVKSASKSFGILDGIDIALFGRMVANAPQLNIEAAASFSHAITTHKASSSVDFFTAVDDCTEDDQSGAGHMGSLEYTSGTYYRYVSVDLGLLADAIGNDEDLRKAVDGFTKALYTAVPSARQTTLSGQCPWSYAHVFIRKGQGTQLTFEKPVKASGEGYLQPSIERMEDDLDALRSLMGSLFGGISDFVYGKDRAYSIDSLCSDISAALENLPEV